MKLKSKPSGRTKKRYLLIEGQKEEIEKAIIDGIGILGYARAGPLFVSQKENKLILAIDRAEVNNILACFEIGDKKIKVVRISGTLKGLGK